MTAAGSEQRGFVTLCSFKHNLKGVKTIYEKVRGIEVSLNHRGEVTELENIAAPARDKHARKGLWEWQRVFFHLFSVKGIWNLGDSQDKECSKVKLKSLEAFLEAHQSI